MEKLVLVKREGEAVIHIRGPLLGKSRCGEIMPPDIVECPRLADVPLGDVCQTCLAQHMRRN